MSSPRTPDPLDPMEVAREAVHAIPGSAVMSLDDLYAAIVRHAMRKALEWAVEHVEGFYPASTETADLSAYQCAMQACENLRARLRSLREENRPLDGEKDAT